MRITIIMLFIALFQAKALESYSQTTKVSVKAEQITLTDLFTVIEKQSEFLFFYVDSDVKDIYVNVSAKDKQINEILSKALFGTNLTYTVNNRNISITKQNAISQQKKLITGKVTDLNDEPIIGVNVMVQGTNLGTITDLNGMFKLEVPAGATLQISYIGYLQQIVSVGDKQKLIIVLKEDTQRLDEVVVVGYGTQKKVNLTGAVSAIGGEKLTETKNESVVNMLTGKLPGVRTTQKSSEPGTYNTTIDIRGYGGSPLIVVDGIVRDNFTHINPEDIENISVLKDATASIYGLRSGNGVVLITTKKGKIGKPQVSYSFNAGFSQMLNIPSQTDAFQFMMMKNEQNRRQFQYYTGFQGSDTYSDEAMQPYMDGTKRTTDWMGAVLANASPSNSHNITLSGGSEKVRYYIGLGALYQDSYFKSGDLNYHRYNLQSNISADLSKYFSVDVGISGMTDKNQQGQEPSWILLKSTYTNLPTDPVFVNDDPRYPFKTPDDVNPVALQNRDIGGYMDDYYSIIRTNVALHFNVPKVEGLAMHVKLGYDFDIKEKKKYVRAHNLYTLNGDNLQSSEVKGPSRVERSDEKTKSTTIQLSIDYNRVFAEKHSFDALFLYEENNRMYDNFGAGRKTYIDSDYLLAGSSSEQYTSMTGNNDFQRVSKGLIGKLHYDYDSKYLIDLSARYDGSSRFKSGSQWGFFPSGAIGWRLFREEFLKDLLEKVYFSDLKVRFSYGKVGDDAEALFQYVSGYNYPASGWVVNGKYQDGATPSGLANENISWFTSTMKDFAVEAKFLDNRLGFTFDYFIRDRDGLLGTRATALPGTFGATLPKENINKDQSKGFEIEASWRDNIGDFNYSVTGFFSRTRTKKVYEERAKDGNSYLTWRNDPNNRYTDIYWGYGYLGQYQGFDQIYDDDVNRGSGNQSFVPGDHIYEDWNGDGVVNDLDKKPIGILNVPAVNFAIDIMLDYKNFDFSMLWSGALKAYRKYDGQTQGPLCWGRNSLDYFWDRWYPADPKADYFDPNTEWVPGYWQSSGSAWADHAANFQNASYLRLKSVEFGYTFDNRLLHFLDKIRLYVNVYNPFTITSFKYLDPEMDAGDNKTQITYPNSRTYNIGAKVTF